MHKSPPRLQIGVVGASCCSEQVAEIAAEVGRGLARRGAVLVCGGLGGVMEAAARGAKAAGGLTVGLLPGINMNEANPYIDIPLATGMGHARNILIVHSTQGLIAVSGGYGTLSEVALALKMGKPVVGLQSWEIDPRIIPAPDPDWAVNRICELLAG